jgi:hypothetical protein
MDPRELFERMIDAWNAHDGDGFVATFAGDCEVSSPVLVGKGHEVVRQFWELSASPARLPPATPDQTKLVERLRL